MTLPERNQGSDVDGSEDSTRVEQRDLITLASTEHGQLFLFTSSEFSGRAETVQIVSGAAGYVATKDTLNEPEV